ncbi:hypothetical protein GCWU000324_03155 [Kingella oralis ATCC 51147]|uniref:Lipoprotein n=1 Tax=Kingella oralis ATCC 51147 TaxID=629741 RepID=C4GN65_9NEIS|nr:hypothetical protein GCWU000324_03155 [Kingella oralis ATCC 51147]
MERAAHNKGSLKNGKYHFQAASLFQAALVFSGCLSMFTRRAN